MVPDSPGRGPASRDPVPAPEPARALPAGLAEPGGQDTYDEDGADFLTMARAILRRKWIVAAFLLAGLLTGYAATLRVTPLYSAAATLEIQKQETRILDSQAIEPQSVADAEFIQTQISLLKSRTLAERVALSLSLDQDPAYADPSAPANDRLLSAAGHILENLKVTPDGRGRIIRVEFVSERPDHAALIPNLISETFIEVTLERKFNTTAYARKFLEERLAITKEQLEASEKRLAGYATDAGLIELGEAISIYTLDSEALIELSRELSAAERSRMTAYQDWTDARGGSLDLGLFDSEELTRLRRTRADLDADYQNRLATYRPEFEDMVLLKGRIDLIDSQIAQERARIIAALEAGYEAALARENAIRERIDGLKGSITGLRENNVDYTILKREVDTNRAQYEALLTRFKELSSSEGITASQISIVDPAVQPSAPFSPDLRRNLLLAGLFGLAAGIGLALVLNYLDDTVHSPEDVLNKLRLPVIGILPKAARGTDFGHEILENPRSSSAEAFFAISASLRLSSDQGVPRRIAITSTQPKEGKSTSSLGIAIAFARSGLRVLIVDADLRRPSFGAGRGRSVGLSGLLTGEGALIDEVIEGPLPGLFLLPSGKLPPDPARILSTGRLQARLEEAEAHFDLIIVDCPPVLGFADAPILANACEATLMVVEAGVSRRVSILRSLSRLQDTNARLAGCILSKFDARRVGYDYNYYYYTYGPGAYEYSGSERRSEKASRKILIFREPPPALSEGREDA